MARLFAFPLHRAGSRHNPQLCVGCAPKALRVAGEVEESDQWTVFSIQKLKQRQLIIQDFRIARVLCQTGT